MNSKDKVKVSELPVGTEGKWKGTVVRVIYLGQNDYSVILVDFGDSDVMTCQGKIPYAEKVVLLQSREKLSLVKNITAIR